MGTKVATHNGKTKHITNIRHGNSIKSFGILEYSLVNGIAVLFCEILLKISSFEKRFLNKLILMDQWVDF